MAWARRCMKTRRFRTTGHAGKGDLLQCGMTFAIEPMINAGRKDIKISDRSLDDCDGGQQPVRAFRAYRRHHSRGAEILTNGGLIQWPTPTLNERTETECHHPKDREDRRDQAAEDRSDAGGGGPRRARRRTGRPRPRAGRARAEAGRKTEEVGKEAGIEVEGVITEALPNAMFRVEIPVGDRRKRSCPCVGQNAAELYPHFAGRPGSCRAFALRSGTRTHPLSLQIVSFGLARIAAETASSGSGGKRSFRRCPSFVCLAHRG